LNDTIKTRYHHGNLREALVARTLLFLENNELEKLSLRKIALLEGVSPTAVYKHFANKEDLLLAVSIAGFRLFSEKVYADDAKRLPARTRLSVFGINYFAFVEQNEALFKLMFTHHWNIEAWQGEENNQQKADEFIKATQSAEAPFVETLTEIVMDAGLEVNMGLIQMVSLNAFASAHGFADLYRCGTLQLACKTSTITTDALDIESEKIRQVFFHQSSELLIEGLLVQTRKLMESKKEE
jgi:AcrR family transcriptional regulator